jgi:hypothetical protein
MNPHYFYITFPYKDAVKRNAYTIIEISGRIDKEEARETARLIAVEQYGTQWAFIYDDEEFRNQPQQYALKVYEELRL